VIRGPAHYTNYPFVCTGGFSRAEQPREIFDVLGVGERAASAQVPQKLFCFKIIIMVGLTRELHNRPVYVYIYT